MAPVEICIELTHAHATHTRAHTHAEIVSLKPRGFVASLNVVFQHSLPALSRLISIDYYRLTCNNRQRGNYGLVDERQLRKDVVLKISATVSSHRTHEARVRIRIKKNSQIFLLTRAPKEPVRIKR